jgi:Ca-activated chloride channel homolog
VGTEMQKLKRQGADVVLVVDTSDSMLAQDVQPSRLEAAKEAAQSLVARLQGGDRIGIVVFAGSAYMYSPLTIDHDAAGMFIDSIERGSAPAPGTALGGAMSSALRLLEGAEHPHKSIVLFSDGEDNEGEHIQAVEEARKQGVRVHVVGLGGAEGEPIPVPESDNQQGKDAPGVLEQSFGAPQPSAPKSKYKHDAQGNVVLSKLDEKGLSEIARRGDGVFVKSSSSGANVDRIAQAIGSTEGAVVGTYEYTGYAERFQWPLGGALALLLLEGLIAAAPRAKRRAKGNA